MAQQKRKFFKFYSDISECKYLGVMEIIVFFIGAYIKTLFNLLENVYESIKAIIRVLVFENVKYPIRRVTEHLSSYC